jgi:nucleoside-diphosphate-sugar epimerase
MRLVVTGATGFLGWRSATLLGEAGHDVLAVARPGGARRAHSGDLFATELDAGAPEARELIAGRDAVLHFAGVPDPARARADPARAVRENVGTTLNLLAGCVEHGAALLYPSTVRAAVQPPPDVYALSKWLGEQVCYEHPAPATVARISSAYGPGQVAWEGATGAIAAFTARALEGAPIVIEGDPERTRDFVYADDVVAGLEAVLTAGRWNETITLASGVATSLRRAAELVREATGSDSELQTPAGELAEGEDASYPAAPTAAELGFRSRPLAVGIASYVAWIQRHPAAQGRARA